MKPGPPKRGPIKPGPAKRGPIKPGVPKRGAINIGLVEGNGPLLVGGKTIGDIAIGTPKGRGGNGLKSGAGGTRTLAMPGPKKIGPRGTTPS
jgi:hypothetical protein